MKIDEVEHSFEGPLQHCKANWNRNRRLVDLSLVPEDIKEQIKQVYRIPSDNDRTKLFNYFVEKKLKNLIENIGDF